MPGSIGAGGVQHVMKGRRMAGHMGNERVTVKNLKIVEVREGGILAIKGAVPGSRNATIEIVAAE
jgi:large subunit ribosomal protein L3